MRICITTLTTTNKFTGIAFYLQKLLKNLQEIDENNQYYIITTLDNYKFFQLNNKNFKEIRIPLNQRTLISRTSLHLFNIFLFPILLLFLRIKVVHFPNTMFVNSISSKSVITIHDIVDQKVDKYGKIRKLYRKFLVKRALKKCNEIITVSENSKNDLLEIHKRNINMIYNGYDPNNKVLKNDEIDILNKYNVVSGEYLIVIGTLLKHKNIPLLVNVFSEYRKQYNSITPKKLLIVGHKENDYESIVSAIQSSKMDQEIQILEYINDEDKLVLLKRSFSFIFFSLYEGFGFPILEAQDMNVPVIILDTSCLKEVSGPSALVIPNLNDTSSLAKELSEKCQLLSNTDFRYQLTNSAKENIYRFNWLDCAKKTKYLYERCCN